MSRRKNIRSKQQFEQALVLERAGDLPAAIKLYQKATTIDPANAHAWNRQMILYRKTKTRAQEVQLIKTALSEFQKSIETRQQDWLKSNQTMADSSRELAKVLGLLEPSGLPKSDDQTIEKWQTRLYLLEYRIKGARKKKTPAKKILNKRTRPVKNAAILQKQPLAVKPKSGTKTVMPKTKKRVEKRPIRKGQG